MQLPDTLVFYRRESLAAEDFRSQDRIEEEDRKSSPAKQLHFNQESRHDRQEHNKQKAEECDGGILARAGAYVAVEQDDRE